MGDHAGDVMISTASTGDRAGDAGSQAQETEETTSLTLYVRMNPPSARIMFQADLEAATTLTGSARSQGGVEEEVHFLGRVMDANEREFRNAAGKDFPPLEAVADVADQSLRLLSCIGSCDLNGAVREKDVLRKVIKGRVFAWLEEKGLASADTPVEAACKTL